MSDLTANDDMVEGFCDGYDLDCPPPSNNRSRSYRHGFKIGRADKTGKRIDSYDELIRAAHEAMALDYADAQPLRLDDSPSPTVER